MNRILLLGSGELGKEFAISAKRLGCYVIACDSYAGAPAMQVADQYIVLQRGEIIKSGAGSSMDCDDVRQYLAV